jgi:SAM-dependent methyltransferase
MVQNGRCALCGSTSSFFVFGTTDRRLKLSGKTFRLVCCNECGLVYVDPIPSSHDLYSFYPKDSDTHSKLAWKVYSQIVNYKIYRQVARLTRGNRILDVGCGDGRLLSIFKRRGWDVFGVEISPTRFHIAKRELNLKTVFNCTVVEAGFESNYFDAVVLNHVFEHLLDPERELEEIKRILKPFGFVYITVPNIDSHQFWFTKENWYHLDIPRHIYHYRVRTATKFLEKCGFKPEKISFPLTDFPLDLSTSIITKYSRRRLSKIVSILVLFPLSTVSFLIQLVPSWRGTMQLIYKKFGEDFTSNW